MGNRGDWTSDELYDPRGLEAYVPALVSLRRLAWGGLPEGLRLLLEAADYLGLDEAIALKRGGLEAVYGRLPGPLWTRVAGRLDAVGGLDECVFLTNDRGSWDRREVIAAVAGSIMAKSTE